MKTNPPSSKPAIPESLNRHLKQASSGSTQYLSDYAEAGGRLVTHEAMHALNGMMRPLREKIALVTDSKRFKNRLEDLLHFFEETLGDPSVPMAVRQDVTFALLYFLKGYDHIPDSIPDIGLLDDAIVVEFVLKKHEVVLKQQALRHGRPWREEK